MKNVSSVRKLSKCMYQVTQDTSAQLFLGECRFGSAVTEQPRVERLEKTQGLIFFIRIEEQGDGCNALSLYRILNANTTASTGIDELECTLWLVDIRTSNISNYNIGHQYESALLTQRVMVTHSDWVSVKSQGLGEVSPSASGTTSWTQGSFQSTSRSRQGLASDGQFRHLDGLSEDPLSYSMEMSSGSQEKTVKRNWIVSLVQVLESFAYHQPSSISVCSPQVLLRVQGAAFYPFGGSLVLWRCLATPKVSKLHTTSWHLMIRS